MSPAPETPGGPPPPDDYAFTPADDRLLSVFLRRRAAGEPLPASSAAHFHEADVYAADPATLTAGYEAAAPGRKAGEGRSWFFFTRVRPKSSSDSRKSRRVGAGGGEGTWHSERAPRPVLDAEGARVGHSQYFSYKRGVGKGAERTDWYMVEFSEDQGHGGGDHDRVQGGAPHLVLCKIYKAHSRSSLSSGLARKRKAADVPVDQVSAPVKAKRRLFCSPSPTPLASSQDKVSSPLQSPPSSVVCLPEASQGEIGFSSRGWYEPEASQSQDKVSSRLDSPPSCFMSMPEASQGEVSSRGWYEPEPSKSQDKVSSPLESLPSVLVSEPEEASQGKIGGTLDFQRFWPEEEEPQVMISSSTSEPLPSFLMPETEAPPDKIIATATSESLLSFSVPEQEAPQCQSETMDWSFLMSDTALPALLGQEQAPGTPMRAPGDETSPFWTGAGTTAASCSPSGSWFLGDLPTIDEPDTPFMCGMKSAPSFSSSSAQSSWCGGPYLWSC